MEFVAKNNINFEKEYRILEKFKIEKLEDLVEKMFENNNSLDYIGELNKKDLMM